MFEPWSHSKLKKYNNCKREFYFQYYLKIKPEDFGLSPVVWDTQQLGNDSHKVMEHAVTKMRAKQSFNLKELISAVCSKDNYGRPVKSGVLDLKRKTDLLKLVRGMKEFVISSKELLQGYPLLIESSFVLDVNGMCKPATYKNPWDMYTDKTCKFVSKPDLVINAFDKIHIFDYKTNEKITADYPWVGEYIKQLEEYAPVVQQALDPSKDVQVNLVNLYTGECISQEYAASIIPAMLADLESKIPVIVDAQGFDYSKPNTFPKCCKFCPFKGKCDDIYQSIVS
ncbi:MAG: PD-(D/E)XK nuclease family protein [Anaerovoracaceae bacterium]